MQDSQQVARAWLWISRLVWAGISLLTMGLWAMSSFVWHPLLPEEQFFGIGMPVGFFVISTILIRWGGHTLIGYVTALMLVVLGPYTISGVNADIAEMSGLLPVINALLVGAAIAFTSTWIFIFPNGKFIPPWTQQAAILGSAAGLLVAIRDMFLRKTSTLTLSVFLIMLFLGIVMQAYRYLRVSTFSERQQTRWVLLGFFSMAVVISIWFIGERLLSLGLSNQLATLFVLMFPVTIAISILLYRLWDIDIIIRRTVMYSSITAALAGVYFVVVTLLQSAFVGVTGQESPLAIVISTLGIAALFTPLRRRVQTFIDRRFNRSKYNAEKTLEAFAESMRDEVDMDHLSAALVGVVEETMQPESVGLWLGQSDNKKGF